MRRERIGSQLLCAAFGVLTLLTSAACGRGDEPAAPPVAAPTVTLSHDRAPVGSPIDITYKFEVASDAKITQDYRVMAHVVDSDEAQMWTFDHNPPVPTSQWKPGETVEYTMTEFIPVYPYIGEAAIHLGLYSTADSSRLPLAGEHLGQYAYRAVRFNLLPQSENLLHIFKEGWHPGEYAPDNPTVEWQWTKQRATLSFKNPRKDALFYLDVDSPGAEFHPAQQVTVTLEGQPLDQFTLSPHERVLRKLPITSAQIGESDMAEIQIGVDRTFIPAKINPSTSKDFRELGIRVFHAFVDAR
jgi:hypothetical protein